MRLLNVVASAGLLFSLVSCGDHSSSSPHRKPAIDQLVTSADWKILLEGRSFPNRAMVAVNDEIVVNECANKQKFFIDRESNPQSLPMPDYKVPSKRTIKIEVTDMGEHCDAESTFFSGSDVPFELTKDGNHAEVIVRL